MGAKGLKRSARLEHANAEPHRHGEDREALRPVWTSDGQAYVKVCAYRFAPAARFPAVKVLSSPQKWLFLQIDGVVGSPWSNDTTDRNLVRTEP